MSRASPYQTFQHYVTQFPKCCYSAINQDWVKQKFNRVLRELQRKSITNNLNPFNLSPVSISFWFHITKNTRLGVTVSSLERIRVSIRQRLLPNDIMHFTARLIQLGVPFPLILLTMFSSLGLWINGAVYKLITNVTTQLRNEQEEVLNNTEDITEFLLPAISSDPSQLPQSIQEKAGEPPAEEKNNQIRQALNPFNLCPLLTIYFPIYKTHTAIGIGFIDFQRLSVSVRQFIEPQDVIYTTIRFIELKVPFSLSIFVLFLAIGLFLNGSVNEFEQGSHKEIMNEVKQVFQR